MDDSPSIHVPVMLAEVLEWLKPSSGQTLVDGTLGGGGHTAALAEHVGRDGLVIALDRDPAARLRAERRLAGQSVKLVDADFRELAVVLAQLGIDAVDGIVLDLGLSSDQLADDARGFSFDSSGPLDLRFDPTAGESAAALLARLGEKELADLIYTLGEERFSRRIARRIVETRGDQPIRTARQLAELVRRVVPAARGARIDSATRTFQALRIAVNDELAALGEALATYPGLLRPGGRMAVISFHSLEDRMVKEAFRDDARLRVMTKRPLRPSEAEVAANPRSQSAKMHVAERVD